MDARDVNDGSGSAEKYTRALNLFRKEPKTFSALMEKLTAAVTSYLKMQIEAGVDVVQIFDSHGGLLAPAEFQEASGRWMREIISQLGAPRTVSACSVGVQASACSGGTLKRELQRAGTVPGASPVIVFSLGTHGNWDDLIATGASALGIDWRFSLAVDAGCCPPESGFRETSRRRF